VAVASFGKPRTSLSVVSASAAITLIVSPRSRIRTSAAPAVPRCSSCRRAASTDTWATRSASHASTPAKRVRETRNVTDCLNELHSAATTADFVVASGSLPLGVHDDYFQRVADVCRDRGAPLVLDTSGAALRHITSGVFMLKPSVRELRECVGRELSIESDQAAAARELIDLEHRERLAMVKVFFVDDHEVVRRRGLIDLLGG
jgi:pfkB family carbohydrate kinase